jgi:hypothetical protein
MEALDVKPVSLIESILKKHALKIGCAAHAAYAIGEVEFWIFWIFNFLRLTIDLQNNSKSNDVNVFFFIFMSSSVEMSFFKEKITK